MMNQSITEQKKPVMMMHVLLGISIGLGSALLSEFHLKSIFFDIYIKLFGIFFLLTYCYAKQSIRPFVTSAIFAVLASFPIYFWQTTPNQCCLSTLFVTIGSAYAINTLHIAYYANRRWLNYAGLFIAVWQTFVNVLISFIFTASAWLLIYLCEALFHVLNINIDFIINSKWFSAIVTCTTFSIGLYIALSAKNVAQNIRKMLLLFCKYTLPILTVISLLFLISWAITFHSISKMGSNTQAIFLNIAFLSILFLNGVYQDGTIEKPYPALLQWLVNIFIITTPIYSVLSLYFFIHTHPLQTSQAMITAINYTILISYNLCYAMIALTFQKPWMKGIAKTNIMLGFLFILIALLTHNTGFHHILP